MHDNTYESEKAILVAIDTNSYDVDSSLEELELLAETAGITTIGHLVQSRQRPDGATFIGGGKLDELAEYVENAEADIVIFDDELTASQIRNIERVCDVAVIDRTMLILDIFAENANTSEGRLQVDLAQHRYLLPRLAGMGKSLSRLGGGSGGGAGARRGKGETKLELDRRHIRDHIQRLEKELSSVEKRREQARDRRDKDNITTVAIVGYTNAGKSTLLNSLTDAGVLAENKLFATLDPTARSLDLPDGRSVMLIDTVGFVRRLPHHLVKAFMSTLEEAVHAELLLNVTDISNPEGMEQMQTTLDLLEELGVEDTPIINVLNKADLVEISEIPAIENSIAISAKKSQGLDALLEKISTTLVPSQKRLQLVIPYSEAKITNTIRKDGIVYTEEFRDDGVYLDALVSIDVLNIVDDFIV